MGCIVIAMPKYDDANRIGDMIRRSAIWEEPVACSTGAEVLNMVHSRDVSVVVCTKKLSDMGYEELSVYLPAAVNMVLLTKDVSLVPFSSNIIKVLMPFRPSDLVDTISMYLPASMVRKKDKKPPKRSAEDQAIIDQAKKMLMERNDMTEPEAFRYLQKNSMDMGRTLIESAQMILTFGA